MMIYCACGCGQSIDTSESRGQVRRFFSPAHKQRFYRHNKSNDNNVTINIENVTNTIIHGDALAVLKRLPDACVQCCVTSPPYYALRDYGVSGQIGMETTPEKYVDNLVAVFYEVRRVLRDDGTLWLNMGDTYANDRRWGVHPSGKHRKELHVLSRPRRYTGLPGKNLLGIPWRLAFALQEDGWILRSDIIWSKPNTMPESVEDRPTKAHEYVFLMAKSPSYFYDAQAIAEPSVSGHSSGNGFKREARLSFFNADGSPRGNEKEWTLSPTRNRRSVFAINTTPYPEAHFAVMASELAEICIMAGTSPKACEHCGSLWQRKMVQAGLVKMSGPVHPKTVAAQEQISSIGKTSAFRTGMVPTRETVGWQPLCTCEHNTGSGKCIVLDPFMGAGTTALVALQHGRSYIGIELNKDYIDLAQKRLSVVQPHLWTGSEDVG